jgi:hypothetical protein
LDEHCAVGGRDGTLDDRGGGTATDGVGHEIMSVPLIVEREEALTALDQTGVVRAAGEAQHGIRAAAHDPSAGRGKESFEGEQRRRCYGSDDG